MIIRTATFFKKICISIEVEPKYGINGTEVSQ